MKKVKKIFFLSKEETKKVREDTGDGYIMDNLPHYLMEDGTIRYGKMGYPDAVVWWDEAGKGINFEEKLI